MKIEWNYELPTLLRALLGAEYIHVFGQFTTLHFGHYISAYLLSPIRIKSQYYHFDDRENTVLEIRSKGKESIVGDLYGMVAEAMDPKYAEQTNSPYQSNIAVYGPINKIVGLGEVSNEMFEIKGSEEQFKYFFPQETILPNSIDINKRTLEAIGFGLSSGKWLYLFSSGEGSFSLRINECMSPEELCKHQDYIAMDKNLQILKVFE